MTHQKHSKLAKPALGQWGRGEWALLGTTCGNIQSLAKELSAHLSPRWKIGYVDADHKEAAESAQNQPFAIGWTDKIGFQRLEFANSPNPWEQRASMNEMDFVLVNGNHFEAQQRQEHDLSRVRWARQQARPLMNALADATGETLPRIADAGDSVHAGTVNMTTAITVEATATDDNDDDDEDGGPGGILRNLMDLFGN